MLKLEFRIIWSWFTIYFLLHFETWLHEIVSAIRTFSEQANQVLPLQTLHTISLATSLCHAETGNCLPHWNLGKTAPHHYSSSTNKTEKTLIRWCAVGEFIIIMFNKVSGMLLICA